MTFSDIKRAVVLAGLAAAWPASGLAQQPAVPVPQSAAPRARPSSAAAEARYQITIMEAVLEKAVEHGAKIMNRQSVTPDLMLLSTPARARGFRLEGYGVFFDVQVPPLRTSAVWSLRALDLNDRGLESALKALKTHVQSLSDQQARQNLEAALRRLELQVNPLPVATRSGQSATASTVETTPLGAASTAVQDDPGDAYTNEVKNALIDAMLEYSGPIAVANDEWLTIAAKDADDSSRMGIGDPAEPVTITLRIKGSTLADFRAGKLTRDEARAKVEIKEF